MKKISIASITVAYNGAALLSRHLDALLAQTHPLNELIIVNNASSDGTLELLSQRYPRVTVINLPSNIGVGGAYAAGLQYALSQKRHDWAWIFDQDSVPDSECLQRLLKTLDGINGFHPRVAILAPSSMHKNTRHDYPGLIWRNGWKKISAQEDVSFVDAVISSGSLIRREAVEQAGPPRTDFFIDFVDLEFCLRLRSKGYEIAVVRDAILHHTLGTPRLIRLGPFSRVWADHIPWREYYKTRNEVFTIWTHYPSFAAKFSVARRVIRHALGVLLFGKEKLSCLKMMSLGIIDGRAGRLGMRYFDDPVLPPSQPKRSHA